jgi:hypothetical protein
MINCRRSSGQKWVSAWLLVFAPKVYVIKEHWRVTFAAIPISQLLGEHLVEQCLRVHLLEARLLDADAEQVQKVLQ